MAPEAPSPAERERTKLHLIDADVHHDLRGWHDLLPYLPPVWRERIGSRGPIIPRRAYENVRGHIIAEDMINPATNLPADDPAWVQQELFDKYGVDLGILTSHILWVSSHPDVNMVNALVRAFNDWTLDVWVRPNPRFKGSIIVAPQDPEAAAAEIDRLGDDPGMVQVLIFTGASAPYGQRRYHPIWAAAERHGLPVALHGGGDTIGISPTSTTVGPVAYYTEHHTLISQGAQVHLVSMVAEGIFEKFPGLKVLFVELGFAWLPFIMWQFDKDFKGNRSELPWLKRLPSEYILDHCRFTTQPIAEPNRHEHLLHIFDMVEAERTLLFSSDFPHWDFDNPRQAFKRVPPNLCRRIFVENALDLYGSRLLAPSA
jgi:predicted TIM-barrel fold metal-dependent hydrolase